MAVPAVTDILTGAAALLGDLSAEQFTSAVLLPWYSMAYREAYNLAMRWGLPAAQRDAFYLLPANTVSLTPAQASLPDMGEPISVWARPNVASFVVTGATNATPIVLTTSVPHNLGTGAPVEIYGVVGPTVVNQQWRVTVISPTTFSLIGSSAGGAYVSGGAMISGGEESTNPFICVEPTTDLPQSPIAPSLGCWRWINDTYRFTGASSDLELWLEFTSSGGAPQSGSVGWDNCQDFLQQRTVSLIGGAYDQPGNAAAMKMEALGPSGQADGTGGSLRAFMYPMLKNKQLIAKRPQPFRRRSVAYGRATGYGGL